MQEHVEICKIYKLCLYICLIHAKSQMILLFFYIQNVKRNWKFCHQYSRNRTNRTIYNFDRLLKYIKTQIFHNTQKLWMNLMIYIFFWKCVFLKIFYVFFKSVICSSWNRLVWARGLIKDKDRNNKLLKIILFLHDDISGIRNRIDMNQKPV